MINLFKILPITFFLFIAKSANAADYDAIALPSNIKTADPAVFINSVYNWGISIVGVLALGQFIISGIIYMTSGIVDQKKAATGRMTDALIGLGIALGAYLFLNLINPTLVELTVPQLKAPSIQPYSASLPTITTAPYDIKKQTYDPTQKESLESQGYTCTEKTLTSGGITSTQYDCILPKGSLMVPITGTLLSAACSPNCYYQTNPELASKNSSGSNWTTTEKDSLYTHGAALSELQDAGITVTSSSGSLNPDQSCIGCTSLNGIPKSIIDSIVDVKNACTDCSITITGGTESGHQSQGFGKASIDAKYDEATYNYLKAQGSSEGLVVVREKQFNADGSCAAGWQCFAWVTGTHMSIYK